MSYETANIIGVFIGIPLGYLLAKTVADYLDWKYR